LEIAQRAGVQFSIIREAADLLLEAGLFALVSKVATGKFKSGGM
jgi:hypothetical protein